MLQLEQPNSIESVVVLRGPGFTEILKPITTPQPAIETVDAPQEVLSPRNLQQLLEAKGK